MNHPQLWAIVIADSWKVQNPLFFLNKSKNASDMIQQNCMHQPKSFVQTKHPIPQIHQKRKIRAIILNKENYIVCKCKMNKKNNNNCIGLCMWQKKRVTIKTKDKPKTRQTTKAYAKIVRAHIFISLDISKGLCSFMAVVYYCNKYMHSICAKPKIKIAPEQNKKKERRRKKSQKKTTTNYS